MPFSINRNNGLSDRSRVLDCNDGNSFSCGSHVIDTWRAVDQFHASIGRHYVANPPSSTDTLTVMFLKWRSNVTREQTARFPYKVNFISFLDRKTIFMLFVSITHVYSDNRTNSQIRSGINVMQLSFRPWLRHHCVHTDANLKPYYSI